MPVQAARPAHPPPMPRTPPICQERRPRDRGMMEPPGPFAPGSLLSDKNAFPFLGADVSNGVEPEMPPAPGELEALYQRYGHVIFHRCRRILGNEEDAVDAVQETFARVLVHYDEFRQEASPLTWMYRISTNLCLNQVRNRTGRADKRREHKALIGGVAGNVAGAEEWERLHTVRRLLAGADEQTQAIVVHIFFDDMTKEQTARMVGLSVPTVRKRLNAFLARARRLLDDDRVQLGAVLGVLLLATMVLR
ncbi:MAG: sigma-70 family RNA polymerase sigma factor [Deltaproteobacteria bacterium]|nr:MAG: sigma-70 family RNA polymerase sigma factor [Deltaproteobacteria bacterium]